MSTSHPASIDAAWQLFREGREAEASACLGMPPASDQVPDSAVRARLAAILLHAGQVEAGMAHLQGDWTQARPDTAGLAGALLFSRGLFDQALPALRHAVAGSAQPAAHAVNLGRNLSLMGRAEEALPWLEQGLRELDAALDPRGLARRSLAEALASLGRFDEALSHFPATPADVDRSQDRAALLAMAGRHDEAAQDLRDALQASPDSIPLCLMAAELAEVRGRSAEAMHLIRQALAKDEDNIALWVRLARSGRKGMGGGAGAREAAAQALKLAEAQPDLRPLALAAQGHVLGEAGQAQEAEAAYREALATQPGLVPALSGLGQLLLQEGRVDEAMRCFEQVRATAPLQGWSQLIQAREVPEDPAVLEAMEQSARKPSLHGSLNPSLLLSVAAAWDKKKEHDRAMRLALEANDAAKPLLGYDPAAHRKRVGRLMARYSADFMASRTGWGHPSRMPVFVLGMPRSGTTLVEQILASHSQIFGAGELGLIPEQIAKLDAWEIKLGSGMQYPDCVADLTQAQSVQFAEQLLQQLRDFGGGARHVIDKLPHNFENIGLIKLLFPNATIFHCRREARDIAVSNFITDYAAKFGGMGFAYDLDWIGEQLVDHDRLLAHWHAVFPGQVMEVVYEDLVEDTEAWARRMLDHLGLPWEAGVLDFQDLDRPVKTASVWQVRQPVYKTSKARWLRYAEHLAPLEAALARTPLTPAPMPLPELPPGLFNEGMRLLQQARPAEAQDCFLRLIADQPEHAAAYQFLGAAQLQQGQAALACQSMRHAVKLLPGHPSWWENLSRAEMAAQRPDAARNAFEQGQRLRAKLSPKAVLT